MTFWLLPETLAKDQWGKALVHKELALPAAGLPDLSRAQGPDQMAGWIASLMPDNTPEINRARAEHYWALAHDVSPEDYLLLPAEADAFAICEITGPYRFESRNGAAFHVWPAAWAATRIPGAKVPDLKPYLSRGNMFEIKDEDTLIRIKSHIPSLRRTAVTIFKWIAITTLISELIYFWPR